MKKVFWCSGLFIRSLRIVVLCSMLFVLRHDLKAWQPVQEVDWKALQCVQTWYFKTFKVAICQEKSNYSTTLLRLWKRNDLVDYAWKVSNGNLDFILTIEGESSFNPKAIGDNGNSVWLCQRHQKRQAETRKNSNFKDPKRQVEQCRKNYSQRVKDWIIHKRLYAYNWRKTRLKYYKKTTIESNYIDCKVENITIFIPTNEK